MTLIAEKSPFKSPRIYDCLRLLALEEVLTVRHITEMTMVTADRALAHATRDLCGALEIDFSWTRLRSDTDEPSLVRRLYGALPQTLKGLVSFRHVASRWPLRRAQRPCWSSSDDAILICSYFIHLDPALCNSGTFHSRHWEALPEALRGQRKGANWLQIFLRSPIVSSVRVGLEWIGLFNKNPSLNGRHAFVDSYLSWPGIRRVVKLWLRLVMLAWTLRSARSAFAPRGSHVSFWPLLRDDWNASLCGAIGVDNCVWLELFDSALSELPRQSAGLYLFENHAWEKAFLRSWRRHGHGRVVGVQHATVPFWYLPYFDDPRCFARTQARSLPLPDSIAVNGPPAREALTAAGLPSNLLTDVEALRYLGLERSVRRGPSDQKSEGAARRTVRLLVLGDIAPDSMRAFLPLVEEAAKLLFDCELTFKPHPGYTPDMSAYPLTRARQTHESLARILPEHDFVIAANNTSAVIDAHVAGLPVAIALSGDGFNLSPLRGRKAAFFVATPTELVAAIRRGVAERAADPVQEVLFFMDSDLPRWKDLLAHAD
jgi:surface carbohydrate biosynthesis protein (TIGR04326 family)